MDTPDFTTLKQCAKCGEVKPNCAFSVDRTRRDGRQPYCKACNAAYRNANKERINHRGREYYVANRRVMISRANDWYHSNKQRASERGHNYYISNRDHILVRVNNYRVNNTERIAQYRVANRESIRETRAKYNAANKDRRAAYAASPQGRAAKLVSKHRRKARKASLPEAFTAADWQFALDHFGGCCAVCGRPIGLWHTLAADHWIPLASPDCPGTVAWNIVPLCHGTGGCNNSKADRHPAEWLIEKYGRRRGLQVLRRVETFLESRIEPD